MRVRISGFGFPVANPVSQGLCPRDGSLAFIFLYAYNLFKGFAIAYIPLLVIRAIYHSSIRPKPGPSYARGLSYHYQPYAWVDRLTYTYIHVIVVCIHVSVGAWVTDRHVSKSAYSLSSMWGKGKTSVRTKIPYHKSRQTISIVTWPS